MLRSLWNIGTRPLQRGADNVVDNLATTLARLFVLFGLAAVVAAIAATVTIALGDK
jgi:hypothetical protein